MVDSISYLVPTQFQESIFLLWAGIGTGSPCLKGVAAVRNELEKKAVGGTLLLRVYRPVPHHAKIS
jgi:hypothetical protein